MMLVGLVALLGKWADSNAWPDAESDPDGAFVWPPNPAGWFPVTAIARPPNSTTPHARTAAGRLTMLTATRDQTPALPSPSRVLLGQNTARPKMASSAGSSVSPASSITPTPMASG